MIIYYLFFWGGKIPRNKNLLKNKKDLFIKKNNNSFVVLFLYCNDVFKNIIFNMHHIVILFLLFFIFLIKNIKE